LSSVAKPPSGDKYLVAGRNLEVDSGTADLQSPMFTALPGHFVQFSCWVQAKQNNLQVLFSFFHSISFILIRYSNQLILLQDETEDILFESQSASLSSDWRAVSIHLPVKVPTNVSLIFRASVHQNVVAVDDIVVGLPVKTHDPDIAKRLSPSNGSKNFISSYRQLNLIHFEDCDQVLNGSGYFNTPNFPDHYPNNIECRWYLQADSVGISVNFDPFHTEMTYDHVTIYYYSDEMEIDEFIAISGQWGSYYFATKLTNRLFVYFYSDRTGSDQGFKAHFQGYPLTGRSSSAEFSGATVVLGLLLSVYI